MSTPEETQGGPKKPRREGIPLERILITLSIFGGAVLILMGTRTLTERVKLSSVPIAGEWQASHKPWRIEFKPDNTIVSIAGPAAADPSAKGKGTYKVDYFGTLWVTLDDGRTYKATLSPEMPNRFDLIEMTTENVTVFEKAQPPKPDSAAAPK
ncbi:MAG: hypothetical protein J2P49_05005 [Methylocapsa sp.]|nr:hypothetical protein [Methylocapsa sp.]